MLGRLITSALLPFLLPLLLLQLTLAAASSCETCIPTSGQNLCHATTSCIAIQAGIIQNSTSADGTTYMCACAHGFKSDSPDQQYRLDWPSQKGRVFVKPGLACNVLCDAWSLGSDGCKDVPEINQCTAAAGTGSTGSTTASAGVGTGAAKTGSDAAKTGSDGAKVETGTGTGAAVDNQKSGSDGKTGTSTGGGGDVKKPTGGVFDEGLPYCDDWDDRYYNWYYGYVS